MFRLFLILLLLYFVYKGVKIFIKYFAAGVKNPNNISGNSSPESKYKDAEEVEFREIKDDSKKESE